MASRSSPFTLSVKLVLLVSGLVLAVSFTMALIMALRTADDRRESMDAQVRSLGQMFGVMRGAGSVRKYDPTLLMTFVEHADKMGTGLAFVLLMDGNQKLEPGSSMNLTLLAEAAPGLAARIKMIQEGEQLALLQAHSWEDESIRIKRIQIKDSGGKIIGVVLFGFSTVHVEAELRQSITTHAMITLAAFFIGVLLATFMAKRFTRPIRMVADAMQRVSDGELDQTLAVTRRDEIGILAHSFNFMTRGLRERERIRNTFARYVSDQVAERILKEQDELDLLGEMRAVTVLFLDIRGFTSLSEHMHPREVVGLLNDYFEIIIEVVFKYEGTVNKFIGDSIMAIYGAPSEIDFPELRAVMTAVGIQQQVHKHNALRMAEEKPVAQFGIGIHSGEAIAGNIGSARRMEYTVIGRDVNLAQRIEASTREGQVLVSETTFSKVRPFVKAQAKEAVFMKGIVEPISLFEVVGLKVDSLQQAKEIKL